MSADLIVDYYRRDLAPAEEEALAQLLQASPEAAERFAQLAAEEYRGFGLPEPGDGPSGRGLKLAGLLLLLGLGAAYAWQQAPARQPVLAVAEDNGSFAVVDRPAPRPVAEAAPAAPAPEAARLLVSAQTPQGPFDIRVSGARAEAGAIYDPSGRRVAGLERLDGRRFRWDGRVAGRTAAPGAYEVRLDAGNKVLKQWVEIEVR